MSTGSQASNQKYRVLRRIGEGGMAEVYLTEMLCQPGYAKHVAVKRVLPHLGRNTRFIRMFLDEARLGLLLNHSNIVQVFDVGRADDAYFIVMEYVDGVNLKQVWELHHKRRALVPIEVSLSIMIQVLGGLHYAHHLADAQGAPLNVVHHDVNPANVLLSASGEAKLVDFGLSEAAVHVEKTDPDIVRGKFGYLSPEVAYGQPADARCDLYAIGIVLYELVTGKRLFSGKDDIESLCLARTGKVPAPRRANPNIPASLERVLVQALARHPDQRYATARDLANELTEVLFEMRRAVNAFAIGDLVKLVRDHSRGERSERAALIEMMIEDEMLHFESLQYDDEPERSGHVPLWVPQRQP